MHKILVITSPDVHLPVLSETNSLTFCHSAQEAAECLTPEFDGLVLDLFLPGTDGLTLLEQVRDRLPPVVLVLTRLITPYVLQAVESLCGGYLLRVPCSGREITHRLEDMYRKFENPVPDTGTVSARYHLRRLELPSGKGLTRMLEILPDFDPRRDPCLFSDFYPALAKRDSVSPEAIDNSIHRTVLQAYLRRNDAVWREYFPDTSQYPSNKAFLTALAERMQEKAPSR